MKRSEKIIKKNKKLEKKLLKIKEKKKIKEKIDLLKLESVKIKNLIRREGGLFDFKGWKRQLIDKWHPGKTMMINMELRNGMHTHFLVKLLKPTFIYEKSSYVIDDALKYYDIASRIYCLDYHQDISIPIKRNIDANTIKNVTASTGITDVETALNPQTLKEFITSDVIQKVMKGEEMDKVFKFLKFMTTLSVILIGIMLLLYLQTSGALSGLSLPF